MKAHKFIYTKTLLVFIALSFVYFYGYINRFHQHKFEWSSEDEIKDLGHIHISEIGFDYIEIKNQPQSLTKSSFSPNSIYKLITEEESLYFKYANILKKDSTTLLASLNWLNHPPQDYGIKNGFLKEVNIPFIDKGNNVVQMIGNSNIWWNEGKRLRYLMNSKNDQLSFVGSNSDAYGFKHEGFFARSLSELNDKIKILPANVYIIGVFSDYSEGDVHTISSLQKTISKIKKVNKNSSIIIVTPFPSSEPEYEKRNQRLRSYLLNLPLSEAPNIHVLDSYEIYENFPKNQVLLSDGVNLSAKGYSLLAKSLSNAISKVSDKK